MRKLAFVIGIAWLVGLVLLGIGLTTSGHFPNVRVLTYALLGAALPGLFLLHWANSKKPYVGRAPNPLAPKAPYDRANEAGHVIKADPHA